MVSQHRSRCCPDFAAVLAPGRVPRALAVAQRGGPSCAGRAAVPCVGAGMFCPHPRDREVKLRVCRWWGPPGGFFGGGAEAGLRPRHLRRPGCPQQWVLKGWAPGAVRKRPQPAHARPATAPGRRRLCSRISRAPAHMASVSPAPTQAACRGKQAQGQDQPHGLWGEGPPV